VRKLLAIVGLLLVAATAQADYFASGYKASGYYASGYFEVDAGGGQVAVPNVIGEADFATADGILEGVLLDGFELAAVCSNEAADEIIKQSIAAGTEVALGTVINLTPSSGMACPDGGGAEYILRRRR
jgi:hypothetical protein